MDCVIASVALWGNVSWGRGRQASRARPRKRAESLSSISTSTQAIREQSSYNGCKTYVDYREMLAESESVDVVIDMTPDHLHGVVNVHAMQAGKHVVAHKTLANVCNEVRRCVEVAKETGVTTHLMAWNNDPGFYQLKDWLHAGIIGKVKEVHNWTNRRYAEWLDNQHPNGGPRTA